MGSDCGRNAMSVATVEFMRFENMEKVAHLTMQGHNPTQISKQLDIKRRDVLLLQQDYKDALANDQEARDMARDHLNMMGKHYDSLIKKFYDLVKEIDGLDFNHQVAGQKNAALKAIAELEAKRLDAFQKAGLLDSAELGDELAKWEEEKELILSTLKDLCLVCQPKVAHKIARLKGQTLEPIEVDYDIVVDDNDE